MRNHLMFMSVLCAAALAPAMAAFAAPAKTADGHLDYGRDLISVTAAGRHEHFPTATCTVWANAEGLGVGRTELGGYHGLTMSLNTQPLPGESATTFAAAMADLKAKFPTAPAWLVKTIEKNKAAIEGACLQEHLTPYQVHAITKQDRDG